MQYSEHSLAVIQMMCAFCKLEQPCQASAGSKAVSTTSWLQVACDGDNVRPLCSQSSVLLQLVKLPPQCHGNACVTAHPLLDSAGGLQAEDRQMEAISARLMGDAAEQGDISFGGEVSVEAQVRLTKAVHAQDMGQQLPAMLLHQILGSWW